MRGIKNSKELRTSFLNKEKADLAVGTFGSAAIEDYAVARWSYMNGFSRQFYWSSAQTIEKLCKLGLILQNKSVKDANHGFRDLFRDISSEISKVSFSSPFTSIEDAANPGSTAAKNPLEFVEQLFKFGTPSTRYFQVSYIQYFDDIHRLDETVCRLVFACDEVAASEFKNTCPQYFEHCQERIAQFLRPYNISFFGEGRAPGLLRHVQSPIETAKNKGEIGAEAINWLADLAKTPK